MEIVGSKTELSPELRKLLLKMQRSEVTEQIVYGMIGRRTKNLNNSKVLLNIAAEEGGHAQIWEAYTKAKLKPNWLKVWAYFLLNLVFGFTFCVKLMEHNEEIAVEKYQNILAQLPEVQRILADEERHEAELLELLDEERLRYVGSMVLGLNDALVELTGTLAGLTFALQNNKLVALSGLITGISATFSMASSEFLSARSEGRTDALKSCTYTGIAYLITVVLLVLPYLLLPATSYWMSLVTMLLVVVFIIFVFNYYISVAQGLNFKKRFIEMAAISLSVAVLSFVVGLAVKYFLGIDV